MAKHMMQFAVTGQASAPMPSRISAWAVYDVFTVKGDERIFLAMAGDRQWAVFCKAFELQETLAAPRLVTNNDRVRAQE